MHEAVEMHGGLSEVVELLSLTGSADLLDVAERATAIHTDKQN